MKSSFFIGNKSPARQILEKEMEDQARQYYSGSESQEDMPDHQRIFPQFKQIPSDKPQTCDE